MEPNALATIDFQSAYSQGGWIGVAALAVNQLLNFWKSGMVDSWLSIVMPGLQWNARGRWARFGIVIALSVAASALAGIAAGQAWYWAILGAVPVAVGAVGMEEVRKTMAKASAESSLVAPVNDDISLKTKLPPLPPPGKQ